MKKITIIVPCYNEYEVLRLFYNELSKYLIEGYEFVILFVNDGSRDKTINLIKELEENDARVKYISFSRNFGKEAAMYAGLVAAKQLSSDAAIFIDADLQDPPSMILEFLKCYEEGAVHIYAKHKTRVGESKLKTFFALQFYKVYAFITRDQNLANGARDFCLLDKKVISAFLDIKDHHRFTKGIFSWVGFDKKCIEFDYIPRAAGTTKWNFVKLFRYAIDGIKQFSRFYSFLIFGLFWLASLIFVITQTIVIVNSMFSFRGFLNELIVVLLFLSIYFLSQVIYDVRDQTLSRPMYIVEDSNLE
jgi:glycosyltransferase involved in cell wall biosynthesis